MDISQKQLRWEEGASGKLTAKNDRDSRVPEAALTSAGPVKGQEMGGSDREDRRDPSHNILLPSAGVLVGCNGGYWKLMGLLSPLIPFYWVQLQSKTFPNT